jgi:hypothetical protein
MNSNEPPIRELNEWFDTVEPQHVPPQILDKVFAVTRRTGQRRGLVGLVAGTLRLDPSLTGRERMNRMILAVGGVAAALVIAVIGVAYLYGPIGPGGPTGPLHVSERHGYSIRLPDDSWFVEERSGTWRLGQFVEANSETGNDYFEDRNEKGEATLYVYLTSQSIPDGMSFEEWVGLSDAANAREQPCFQLVGSDTSRALDGETARTGTYRCDNFEETGNPHTGVETMVAHNGRGYAIYVWPVPDAPGFPPPSDLTQAELEAKAANWLSRFSFTD